MSKLEGKVAVVTGGSRGISRATCEVFVSEGANVYVVDKDESGGKVLAAALGQKATFHKMDITDELAWGGACYASACLAWTC